MRKSIEKRLETRWRGFADCLGKLPGARFLLPNAPLVVKIDAEGHSASIHHLGQLLGTLSLFSLAEDSRQPSLLHLIRKRPVILVLPESWVLQRRLTLPAAARGNLRQVVGFELDRLTPFGEEQAYFDARELSATPEKIRVELLVVPRPRVQPWIGALERHGAGTRGLAVSGNDAGINLLPPHQRHAPGLVARLAGSLPLLALSAVAGSALWLPLWQAHHQLEALKAEEARLRVASTEVLDLQRRLEHQLSELEKTAERWKSAAEPLELLAQLSRLLPRDTFLRQLRLEGNRLILQGLSTQASQLIALLESSPAFEHARFLSPITHQEGKELFHLTVGYHPSSGRADHE